MNVVIVGCGRVGAFLAEGFDAAGHQVIVIDTQTNAFDRLPGGFRGNAVRGNGTDEDVLRRAGAQGADLFLALTEGDNRNVMAVQVALEGLGVRRAIAKINDPVRARAYADLGHPGAVSDDDHGRRGVRVRRAAHERHDPDPGPDRPSRGRP